MLDVTGSIVAIVTPFKNDGSIDFQSFELLVEFHLIKGSNGIVVGGTTGEGCALTTAELSQLVTLAVKKVNGAIPIIAGTGTNVTAETIERSLAAKRAGANGLLLINPYYNKPTEKFLYLHFSEIANAVDLPVILYNVPSRTGYNMSPSLILRLAREFKNIRGVKEASGNVVQAMEIIRQRPNGFRVYSGDDVLALPICALGGDGCISVVANLIPHEFSQLVNAELEGKHDLALTLHYRYLDLMQSNFIETNPVPVKTALAGMGYVAETFRAPLYKWDDCPERETYFTILKKHGLLAQTAMVVAA
ncbi:MAG: 4-hydroxy-tetrahydrodipicolinate synthase [Flavobacteriales bacterium]